MNARIPPSLGYLFLVASLFPFVSFYPVSTDVQPIFLLFSIFIVFFTLDRKLKFNITNAIWMVILVAFSFFYINLNGSFNILYSKQLAIVFVPVVIYAIYSTKGLLTFNFIYYVFLVYFILSILMFIQFEFFSYLQSFFVRNINSSVLGYRGISTLSTEPGLFAGHMIAIYLILESVYKTSDISTKRLYKYKLLLSHAFLLIMIYLSKSGTGFAYYAVYLSITVLESMQRKQITILILLVSVSSIFLYSIIDQSYIDQASRGEYGRGLQIVFLFLLDSNKLSGDTSIFYRIYGLFTAIHSLGYYPFGTGIGDVDESYTKVLGSFGYLQSFYLNSVLGYRLVSSTGYYIMVYGLFFLVPYIYLIYRSKASIKNKIFFIIFTSFSYSFLYPLVWFILFSKQDPKL